MGRWTCDFTRLFAVAVDAGYLHTSYNPVESSSTATVLAGPRFFFPVGATPRLNPLRDFSGAWQPSAGRTATATRHRLPARFRALLRWMAGSTFAPRGTSGCVRRGDI